MGNSAFMHRFDALGGLELLVADFSDHRFDVHWHDTWSIGVVLRGANNNSAKGDADGIVCRGQVSIIAPGHESGADYLIGLCHWSDVSHRSFDCRRYGTDRLFTCTV